MTSKQIRLFMGTILFSLLVYWASILIGHSLFSNLTSPVVALLAALAIHMTRRTERVFEKSWRFLIAAVLSWALADLAWMVADDLLHTDPETMPLVVYLYLLPNLFLLGACVVYFLDNVKKWHKLQLYVDGMTTLLISLILFWFVILGPFAAAVFDVHEAINIIFSLSTDFISLAILFIMYSSSRVQRIGVVMRLVLIAITTYCTADIFYIYSSIRDVYVPNSFLDFAYMISIGLFGLIALYEHEAPIGRRDPGVSSLPENVGKSTRFLWLFALPLLLYAGGLIAFGILIHIIAILLINQLVSAYVQIAIEHERLLSKEKLNSESLELQVAERTKELLEANQVLNRLTQKDPLTGLYNRRYFIELLETWTQDKDQPFTMLYMDLDRFKTVNDSYGHSMGDEVLKIIAERFEAARSETTVLARLGGDEFVVLMERPVDQAGIIEKCQEIVSLVIKPVVVGDFVFHLGVSIGAARFPQDAIDGGELLKYADLAMYTAKKQPFEQRFAIYYQEAGALIKRRHQLELKLRGLKFDEAFELHYQPQFDTYTHELVGVEALLRWHTEDGWISPSEFIPIAEETGVIVAISRWVMAKAAAQIKLWNEGYGLNLIMGVNISPKMIDSVDFVIQVERYLRKAQVKPEWIDFEITESSAMSKAVVMEEILTGLSSIGVKISIDDFGTGYSSLSYIKRFDVDRLKIAKELIDYIVEDPDELMIVKAIVMMAKGMGIRTIAEGVETGEQLECLQAIGCDEIQGYYFSRPLPAEELERKYLKETRKSL